MCIRDRRSPRTCRQVLGLCHNQPDMFSCHTTPRSGKPLLVTVTVIALALLTVSEIHSHYPNSKLQALVYDILPLEGGNARSVPPQ